MQTNKPSNLTNVKSLKFGTKVIVVNNTDPTEDPDSIPTPGCAIFCISCEKRPTL
ncbi:hypothetical protein GCM10025859_64970 [Alicyclobacillus fastidiosus]|nr:hypothetical protein GCM10025859_64970 [Alicyclobacillus fastidiosus]